MTDSELYCHLHRRKLWITATPSNVLIPIDDISISSEFDSYGCCYAHLLYFPSTIYSNGYCLAILRRVHFDWKITSLVASKHWLVLQIWGLLGSWDLETEWSGIKIILVFVYVKMWLFDSFCVPSSFLERRMARSCERRPFYTSRLLASMIIMHSCAFFQNYIHVICLPLCWSNRINILLGLLQRLMWHNTTGGHTPRAVNIEGLTKTEKAVTDEMKERAVEVYNLSG